MRTAWILSKVGMTLLRHCQAGILICFVAMHDGHTSLTQLVRWAIRVQTGMGENQERIMVDLTV